jgi:hypothetical protein
VTRGEGLTNGPSPSTPLAERSKGFEFGAHGDAWWLAARGVVFAAEGGVRCAETLLVLARVVNLFVPRWLLGDFLIRDSRVAPKTKVDQPIQSSRGCERHLE